MVVSGCYHKWFGLACVSVCSQLLLRSCIAVLEQDTEAPKEGKMYFSYAIKRVGSFLMHHLNESSDCPFSDFKALAVCLTVV